MRNLFRIASIPAALLALTCAGLAQHNRLADMFESPSRIEPGSEVAPAVIRTAPFTGGSGYGCTEDTSTGEMYFSELKTPFVVEVRTKDLTLVRTINIPNPGQTMTGIAYDAKNDTLWCADTTTIRLWEYDKNTGNPTGNFVLYSGGIIPGAMTIDLNDGNGGDLAYIYETFLDRVDRISIRSGQNDCNHPNPLGQPAFGNGLSYAKTPRFPGELFITTGADSAGQVTDIYRGNPCVGVEYTDPIYVGGIGGNETFPNGIQNTLDPSVDPSEVFYFLGNATGTIFEVFLPKWVGDCQGIDGENVVFVNGTTAQTVDLVEGWPFHFGIWKPSGGGPGRYLVHMNAGHPGDHTITTLPFELGDICFPVLLPPFGSADPVAVWNNVGGRPKAGSSNYFGTALPDPPAAPAFFYDRPGGDAVNLPAGSGFTLQGVILNPAASSSKGASVTNAIAITVVSQP